MSMASITPHHPAEVPRFPASSAALEFTDHRRVLFVSGQVALRPDGTLPSGFEAQCEQVWRNVIAALAAAGLGVEHLVKVTTYLTDRSQVILNRAIRQRVLGPHEPAATTVIAQTLDPAWLLEIEAIAAA
jgi:enamine deaminase RidA (YjgF/YER057c/UK114 family)